MNNYQFQEEKNPKNKIWVILMLLMVFVLILFYFFLNTIPGNDYSDYYSMQSNQNDNTINQPEISSQAQTNLEMSGFGNEGKRIIISKEGFSPTQTIAERDELILWVNNDNVARSIFFTIQNFEGSETTKSGLISPNGYFAMSFNNEGLVEYYDEFSSQKGELIIQ